MDVNSQGERKVFSMGKRSFENTNESVRPRSHVAIIDKELANLAACYAEHQQNKTKEK